MFSKIVLITVIFIGISPGLLLGTACVLWSRPDSAFHTRGLALKSVPIIKNLVLYLDRQLGLVLLLSAFVYLMAFMIVLFKSKAIAS